MIGEVRKSAVTVIYEELIQLPDFSYIHARIEVLRIEINALSNIRVQEKISNENNYIIKLSKKKSLDDPSYTSDKFELTSKFIFESELKGRKECEIVKEAQQMMSSIRNEWKLETA
ncbi:MAG: hypothetical protein DRG78_03670, partial [Epsilonproteobacteria bacterium]